MEPTDKGISRIEIRNIYNSCDVFLSPSWAEGSQAPPMEAMACGCAVLATNVGGIPDYAIAGETAAVSSFIYRLVLQKIILHES